MNTHNEGLDSVFSDNAGFDEPQTLCQAMNNSGFFTTEDQVIENLDIWINICKKHLDKKGFDHADAVMDKTLNYNKGKTRKDGITPSVIHELTQFTWLMSCLDDDLFLTNPEAALINDLAHDLGEDHGVLPSLLIQILAAHRPIDDPQAAKLIENAHDALSKQYAGEETEGEHAKNKFKDIAEDPIASVVKLLDRIHNIATHIGVKTAEKSASYIKSTRENFIPLIENISKELFPEQTEIYDALLGMLDITCILTEMHYDNKQMPNDDTLRTMMPDLGFKDMPDGINPLFMIANRSRKVRNEYTPSTGNSSTPT